jgi:hypothetical protein
MRRPATAVSVDAPLSAGEVHFLWWFIQGSIMVPETRWRLRRAWGMCERHAWGALSAETAYRHTYLHGPCLLYRDIMERALHAFDVHGPAGAHRVGWRLRETGPCLMCECGFPDTSKVIASTDLIATGRNPRELCRFAEQTRPHWWDAVCGRCADLPSSARCRIHFREEVSAGHATNVDLHGALVARIVSRLSRYARSFVWGYRDTETDAARAALVTAVGWCSGWRPLIRLLEDSHV